MLLPLLQLVRFNSFNNVVVARSREYPQFVINASTPIRTAAVNSAAATTDAVVSAVDDIDFMISYCILIFFSLAFFRCSLATFAVVVIIIIIIKLVFELNRGDFSPTLRVSSRLL